MENHELVATLNNLVEICKDGEEGFRGCADDAVNPLLKSLFADRAQGCATAARELQDLVRAYGGRPETRSSIGGKFHRRWIDIKSAVMGKDDEAVLNECERGEEIALRAYRETLNNALSTTVRTVVERQLSDMRQHHAQIERLREQVRTTS